MFNPNIHGSPRTAVELVRKQAVFDEIASLAAEMPGTARSREAFKAGLRWVIGEMNRRASK